MISGRCHNAAPGDRKKAPESLHAACAEVAYWRYHFIIDRVPLLNTDLLTEHTFFQAKVEGRAIDLISAPWVTAYGFRVAFLRTFVTHSMGWNGFAFHWTSPSIQEQTPPLGGWQRRVLAERMQCARYGTMRENVLALEFVAADGEVIRTGTRARKSSAGYDLTRLLVGSEGTLGIMTELTLRLYPLPEAVRAAICSFPSVDTAVQAAMQLIQMGVPLARCELMDTQAVKAVNARDRLGLRESPMLLMVFHGSSVGVAEQVETAQSVASDQGGESFEWADTPEQRSRLWAARHHAYLSALLMRPGCRCVTTDTCVPISRLAENINESIREAEEASLPYFIVGHVGDGNVHLGYLIDPALLAERELAEMLSGQMVRRTLRMGGTCTGEHGNGKGETCL